MKLLASGFDLLSASLRVCVENLFGAALLRHFLFQLLDLYFLESDFSPVTVGYGRVMFAVDSMALMHAALLENYLWNAWNLLCRRGNFPF